MPNLNISVGVWKKGTEGNQVIPVTIEKANIRKYDCREIRDTVVYIFASSDVSVNVYLEVTKVSDSNFFSVVVYPTDTHTTEYQGINPGSGKDYCYPVSVHEDVQLFVYNGRKVTAKVNGNISTNPGLNFSIENVFIRSTKIVSLRLLYIFNKPSALFCFNEGLKILYQSLPLNAWSTNYIVPAWIQTFANFQVFKIRIFTTRDNTTVRINNSTSNYLKFLIKEKVSNASDYGIDLSSLTETHTIQSSSATGVGLNFVTNTGQELFSMLPPQSNFLTSGTYTIIPLNMLGRIYNLNNATVSTFAFTGNTTESPNVSELDKDVIIQTNGNNNVSGYSISVVIGDNNKTFIFPGYSSLTTEVRKCNRTSKAFGNISIYCSVLVVQFRSCRMIIRHTFRCLLNT